jgi:NitT/TauT family transport system substrate-binding protein
MELFVAGDTDAFLGFPTEPQELRARGFNRVILSTITDRPWSQYFCCLIHGNRAWVRDHRSRPSVFCARSSKPPSSAKPTRRTRRAGSWMAGSRRSTTTRSRRSKSSPLRSYALRLHEAGILRTSPNALLAEGADWRFVNELKA